MNALLYEGTRILQDSMSNYYAVLFFFLAEWSDCFRPTSVPQRSSNSLNFCRRLPMKVLLSIRRGVHGNSCIEVCHVYTE